MIALKKSTTKAQIYICIVTLCELDLDLGLDSRLKCKSEMV